MDVDQYWSQFSTSDLDEAHRFMSAAYVDLKVHSTRASRDFQLQASAGHIGDIPISRLQYPASTRLSAAPNADLSTVRLPRRLVEEVAEAATGLPVTDLRFRSFRPLSQRLEQQWLQTTAYAAWIAMSHAELGGGAPGRLLLAQTRRLLAAAFLAAYPSTVTSAVRSVGGGRRVPEPAALRRAMDHIQENAHRDFPLGEVARAAGLSVRSLRDAFRVHRDTTPGEFTRRVRLERAHRDLQVSDPAAGVTVTQVARRWGFANPGRFARYYRHEYGLSPRRTLHS